MTEFVSQANLVRALLFVVAGFAASVGTWTGKTVLDLLSATERYQLQIERIERDIERLERRVSQ